MKTPTIKRISIAIATALLVCAAPVSVFAAEDSPLECENDIHYECDSLFVLEEQSDVNSDEFGSVSSDFNADFQLDNAGLGNPRWLKDPEWAKRFRPKETDPRYKGSKSEFQGWFYWATDWADLGPDCYDDSLILQCLHNGFMRGMSDTYFGKNEYLTRAQMVQVLYNMKELFEEPINDTYNPKFKDVPDGQWYSKAVSWAANTGVTKGISEDEFGVDRIVTAQEVCVFFDRFFDLQGERMVKKVAEHKSEYPPTKADAWAADSVYRCYWAGLGFQEYDYDLEEVGCHHDIKGPASRRDVAVLGNNLGDYRWSTRSEYLRD